MHLIRNTAITCVSLTVITGSAAAQPTTFNQLYTSPVSLPAGLRPYDVKAGDFNGDGRVDVAVVNRGLNGSGGSVSVYLLGGTGQFAKLQPDLTAELVEPISLAVGDLNGDGLADLVVGDFGRGGIISFVAQSTSPVFLDVTAKFFAAAAGTVSVDLGFLDAGTVLDAAAVNFSASSVSRMIGDGAGGFTVDPITGTTPTINGPRFIRIGNLDGFGVNDAMVVNNATINPDGTTPTFTTRLLFSNIAGIFNSSMNIRSGGFNKQGALGDIDGDGDTDIAVTNALNGTIVLFRNDTLFENNPVFTEIAAVSVGSSPYSVALGDVDGDGDLDLCVTHRNSDADDITIALNNGDGTFGAQLKFAFAMGYSPRSIDLVDLDNDGDLDLLTTRKPDNDTDTMGNPVNGELLVFENLTITSGGSGDDDLGNLRILMGNWGPEGGGTASDYNKDGMVNAADMAILLANWSDPNNPQQGALTVPWVIAHFGFDSVESYIGWIELLTEDELFSHIAAMLDLITEH